MHRQNPRLDSLAPTSQLHPVVDLLQTKPPCALILTHGGGSRPGRPQNCRSWDHALRRRTWDCWPWTSTMMRGPPSGLSCRPPLMFVANSRLCSSPLLLPKYTAPAAVERVAPCRCPRSSMRSLPPLLLTSSRRHEWPRWNYPAPRRHHGLCRLCLPAASGSGEGWNRRWGRPEKADRDRLPCRPSGRRGGSYDAGVLLALSSITSHS